MTSLFSGLITSKTRIKILMRLFLNPQRSAYISELADEFAISPSQVKDELQQLSDAGFLTSQKNGRQIHFNANQDHPLFILSCTQWYTSRLGWIESLILSPSGPSSEDEFDI